MKRKRIIIACAVTGIYYLLLFAFRFTLSKSILLSPADYQISENCIVVRGQVTTGPEYCVIEGVEYLSAAVPVPGPDNLNASEIEITGESIYDGILEYPDYYACNWLVYGQVVGTTDRYEICGSGSVPVFEAEKVYPMMSVSEFLSLEIILFAKFPIGLILAACLYVFPIGAGLLVVIAEIKRARQ